DEVFGPLAGHSPPDKLPDPDAHLKLKGARRLDPRGQAILRELYRAREALALEVDRPPFMIASHEALVAMAARRPRQREELLEVPGFSARWAVRAGPALLDAIVRGEAVPDPALRTRRPGPRPHVPAAVRGRTEALRAMRGQAVKDLGLDPGVLFPQRLIDRLAAEPPRDLAALERVDGIRRWRVELLGAEVLKALAVV